ncbi:MAG: glycosyltransferase [Planctomycetota bacterium]
MRILLASNHRYPAYIDRGVGRHARPNPSCGPGLVHDLLARGLAELGHTVFYLLENGHGESFPPGVFPVSNAMDDVDIYHNLESTSHPWVITRHGYNIDTAPPANRNTIFVSHALAQVFNFDRAVWNGIDPDQYVYSSRKSDYFLFLAAMQGQIDKDKYHQKGLGFALALCKKADVRLIVAGTAVEPAVVQEISRMCAESGAEYVGDVRGEEKAKLLAEARGLLFPTQVIEGFGLAMVEALVSGTPVICSNRGACPELIPTDVGFVCESESDYLLAIERIGEISSARCRDVALERYHYRQMSCGYLREYEREIAYHQGVKHA